jgi:hypothetical protein
MLPLRKSRGTTLQAPLRGVIDHLKLTVRIDFARQRVQSDRRSHVQRGLCQKALAEGSRQGSLGMDAQRPGLIAVRLHPNRRILR